MAKVTTYTADVLYTDCDNNACRFQISGMDGTGLHDFRQMAGAWGIMRHIDPGHWILVLPQQIKQIDIYKVTAYQ